MYEILNLIESVSEGFPSYSSIFEVTVIVLATLAGKKKPQMSTVLLGQAKVKA